MKLKKIASLALAGVMAISMLAGCATNNTDNKNEGNTNTEVTVTSTVLDTIKAAVQNANKDFKLTYKDLPEMGSKMSTELAKVGPEDWEKTAGDVIEQYYTGATKTTNVAGFVTEVNKIAAAGTTYYYTLVELDNKVTGATPLVMEAYNIASELVKLPARVNTNQQNVEYTLSAFQCDGKKADGTTFTQVVLLVKAVATNV